MCNPVKAVQKTFSRLGTAVDNILQNPLPVIETAALMYFGIPAPIASATVTAANGGSMRDIALAAASSYAAQQVGTYAGEQYSPIEQQTLQQMGPQYANEAIIKDVITSASGSAAVAALRGQSLDKVLTAAASGAISGYVNQELINNGYDPKAIDSKLISGAVTSATSALLNGKSVMDAVAQSTAAIALSSAVSSGLESLKSQQGVVQSKVDSYNSLVAEAQKSKEFQNASDLQQQYAQQVAQYNSDVANYKANLPGIQAAFNAFNTGVALYNSIDSEGSGTLLNQSTVPVALQTALGLQYVPASEDAPEHFMIPYQNEAGYTEYTPAYSAAQIQGSLYKYLDTNQDNIQQLANSWSGKVEQLNNMPKVLENTAYYANKYQQEFNDTYQIKLDALAKDIQAEKDTLTTQATNLSGTVDAYNKQVGDDLAHLIGEEAAKQVEAETTAIKAGFPDAATSEKYEGKIGEYQYDTATKAGFKDYATYKTFNGDLGAYQQAQAEEAAAKQAEIDKAAAQDEADRQAQEAAKAEADTARQAQAQQDFAKSQEAQAKQNYFPDADTARQYGWNTLAYAKDLGFPSVDALKSSNGDLESYAKSIGFPDLDTYKAHSGDINEYVKSVGFPSVELFNRFDGDTTAYQRSLQLNTSSAAAKQQGLEIAKAAGFPDYATYVSYAGNSDDYLKSFMSPYALKRLEFPDIATAKQYNYDLRPYLADKQAEVAAHFGFPDAATYYKYSGDSAAYEQEQSQIRARGLATADAKAQQDLATGSGFPDYTTYQKYDGNSSAYKQDQNELMAKDAKFPDFATYSKYNGDLNEYKAQTSGWNSYADQQQAARYEITDPKKWNDFVTGKTEEDKIVQMLQDRGITPTPERVADIMKSWDFNPTTPNTGFSDAFDKTDKLNISNVRADSVQEAAALAKSLGYSSFSFGGGDYKINTQAPQGNPYDFFASRDEAFKAARADLGAGQVFPWTDPATGKTGYYTTNYAGEKVSGGGFDAGAAFNAKSRLIENLQDGSINPADLTASEMAKFVDNFVNATPQQRASLLNGKDSMTYQSINNALTTTQQSLDSTAEAIKSGQIDPTKPIAGSGSIKASDVNNYKQILAATGNNVATDIASTSLSGAVAIGSLLGLDTKDVEDVQKLLSEDKNKQMDKLVGLEKNAAAGFSSAIESAFAFALGGAPGAIGGLTAFAANNAWLEGKDAGLSNVDNAQRTMLMASLEAAGEAVGIPGLSRLMKGVPITGSATDLVNGVKNAALALGNEQVSELATTAAQFAVDKFTGFGLNKNSTYQDFVDALKDTALTTAFSVGGSGSIGQAARALQQTSTEPNQQLLTPVTPDQLWDQAKQAGISQSEIDAVKNNLANSFGSQNYTVQQVQENLAQKLEDAGFNQQQIDRLTQPAVTEILNDKVTLSLEAAGVPATHIADIANQVTQQLLTAPDQQSAFAGISTVLQSNGLDPLAANLVTNETLTGTNVKTAVKDAFTAQGYTPTQAEIDALISQNVKATPDAISTAISNYTGPRMVTADEARAALVSSGLPNPTQAQIDALTGQYDQNLLASRANTTAGDISTQISNLDQAGMARDEALSRTLNEISAQVTANKEAGMNSDQALSNAIDKVASNLGTTKDALLAQIGSTESQLRSEMQAGQALTASQISGLESQLTEQGRSLVAQLQQQGESYQQALSDAIAAQNSQIAAGQQQTAEQIKAVKDSLTTQITANEAAGLTRDQATTKAIDDLAAQMGVDRQSLLGQIGTTEQALRQEISTGLSGLSQTMQQQYSALSAAQKAQFDAMVQQGADINAAMAQVQSGLQSQIGNVQTQLSAAMAANEAAGMSRDQALSKAIDDVSASLGTTKEGLLSQIGKTETVLRSEMQAGLQGVQQSVADTKAALQTAIDAAKASGLAGDAALQSAINSVAAQAGVDKQTLLNQLGTTEQSLRSEFQTGISGLTQAMQDQYSALNAAQKAQFDAMVQQGADITSAMNTVQSGLQQQITTGQQQTAEQIATVKQSLTDQIAANEAAGLSRDQATTKAISDLSTQMGVDKQSLLSQLGTTEQALRQELTSGLAGVTQDFQAKYDALNASQKAQFDALVQQGTELNTALQTVQSGLQQQIGELSQTQSQQYSQLSQGQKDLYNQLLAQGATQSDALNAAVAGLSQTQAQQYSQLSQGQKDLYNQMIAQGASQTDALNTAISGVQGQISGVQQSLEQQLAQQGALVQQQYAGLNAAQQAEVAARIAQGESLQNAIAASQAATSQQITGVQQALQAQLAQQSEQTQQAFAGMNAAQQAEVAARIQQGQDLQTAISGVQASLGQQITGGLSALSQDFQNKLAASDAATQTAFGQMSAAQQAETQARVQQGQDLQSAISASQQATQQQIAGLSATQAQQYGALSQGQKDLYNQMVAQGTSQTDALNAAVSGLQASQAQQYSQLTQGQKDLYNQMVSQGASQTDALNTAISGVQQQITTGQQQTAEAISRLDQSTQAKFDALTESQKQQALQLAQNTNDLQGSINTVSSIVTQNQAATQAEFEKMRLAQEQQAIEQAARDKAAKDAADAQAAALKKQLEDQAIAQAAQSANQASAQAATQRQAQAQSGLSALAGTAPSGGGSTGGAGTPASPLQAQFLTSTGGKSGFINPLASVFALSKMGLTGDNQGAQQNTMQTPHYNYGNVQSVDEILGMPDYLSGLGQEPQEQQAARGGLMTTPLMAAGGMTGTRYGQYAGGGLPSNIVHHSGKARVDFRSGDAVTGAGDGQSDDIPAMLADGEFVFPADVVAAIGNGSTKAGSDKLYDMMHGIRAHVRSAKPKDLPPEIKSPLDFLGKKFRKA